MLLLLQKDVSATDLTVLGELAQSLSYELRVLDRGRRVAELVPLPGGPDGRDVAADRSKVEDLACVASVLDGSDAPERHAAPGETVVRVGDAAFGGGSFALVAGPCAVESPERLLEIAESARAAGATLLRGGAFKPRTSPYSFQGLGAAGLELLDRVRRETGLGIVTEVLDPRHVAAVADVADMLQIGSRSMSNAALLREAGRSGKPVLVKRGLAATVRELLLAAEHVLAEGNPNVVLCERGIRGFDDVTRNLLDVGAIAHLKAATHLPVVVDPSHAAGRPDLVLPLARAGVAAGADGLLVEVHPAPSEVHSDGAQAISLESFHDLARAIRPLVELEGKQLSRLAHQLAP